LGGAVFATALGALVALVVALGGDGSKAAAGLSPSRPNIVVIQTDDQTVQQMRALKNTRRLLGERGATFRRHYVNWPLCCPSRATLLTGQYAHNHGVLGNAPPNGGYPAFDTENTTAVWLQARGYETAHIGKLMNLYGNAVRGGPDEIPPGWDEWYTVEERTQAVYNYFLNENGAFVRYGNKRSDFKQDVLTTHAVELIGKHIGGAPLYLQLDYTAPHNGGPNPVPQPPFNKCLASAKPAPRHAGAFAGEPLPRPPSFNEADVSDKPEAIKRLARLNSTVIQNLSRGHRCRLESLLSVDEGVAKVVRALRIEGALANTFVIFTSDNGFFTGEHRVTKGKTLAYEPAIRVPLLIRGPGVPKGVSVRDLTINADIAPTVVEVSGAQPTHPLDGRSLIAAAQHPWIETGRELLIETQRYEAIQTQRYVWVEYDTGERELYDLHNDPHQLRSDHDDPSYAAVRRRLEERLAALRSCAGETCRKEVALSPELSPEPGPDGCTQPPVVVKLAGDDLKEVDDMVVFVNGQPAGRLTSGPFRIQLDREELGGAGLVELRVRASLIDGRRIGWEQELQICE
jgi:arylsulfatase A-like enzyme